MFNLIFTTVLVLFSSALGEYLTITPFMDSTCSSSGGAAKCVELDTCFPLGPSMHVFGKLTYEAEVATLLAYLDPSCTVKMPIPFEIER